MDSKNMVMGVFPNQAGAEGAIDELEARGFNPDEVSIILKDRTIGQEIEDNTGADVATGALSGATTGGVVGVLAGLLVATGVFPGIGAILVGGPIATALGLTGAAATAVSGAVTGVVAGGLIGALTSLGLSEDDARMYESRINEGEIFVAVPIDFADRDQVTSVFERYNADKISFAASTGETIDLLEPIYMGGYEEGVYYSPAGMKGGQTGEEAPQKSRPRSRRKKQNKLEEAENLR